MFALNSENKGVDRANEGKMVSILHSINEPKIAALDRPAEPTQAFICSIAAGSGAHEMHIILYLSNSHFRVVYSWDGPVSKSKHSEVEEEALDFVENMGFMMDNMNLSKFSGAQRQEILNTVPVFAEPEKLEEAEDAEDEAPILEVEDSQIFEAETAVRRPPPPPPEEGADLMDGDSLEALEAEFERDDVSLDSELDSAMESLLPEGSEEEAASAGQEGSVGSTKMDSARLRGVIRLLSSF